MSDIVTRQLSMHATVASGALRSSGGEMARPLLNDGMREQVAATASKLLRYCRSRNWAGIDPYDAMNSRLFKEGSVLNRRLTRLAFTQLLKRSPVNLRPLLLIPETQNPKALALFRQRPFSTRGLRATRNRRQLSDN